MKAITTFSLLVLGTAIGGCAGGDNICDSAWEQLSSCGVTLPHPGECTAAKAQLASEVLASSCERLTERRSFSASSCDSIWALFMPSCWFNDDEDWENKDDDDSPQPERCYVHKAEGFWNCPCTSAYAWGPGCYWVDTFSE